MKEKKNIIFFLLFTIFLLFNDVVYGGDMGDMGDMGKATDSETPAISASPTPTRTMAASGSNTRTSSPSITSSSTFTPTSTTTSTPSPSPTRTPTSSITGSITPSNTPTPSITGSVSISFSPSRTVSTSLSNTPTVSISRSPSKSVSSSVSPSIGLSTTTSLLSTSSTILSISTQIVSTTYPIYGMSSGGMSFSACARADSAISQYVQIRGTSGTCLLFTINSNTFSLQLLTSGGTITATSNTLPFSLFNQFHSYVITISNTGLTTFYLDGVSVYQAIRFNGFFSSSTCLINSVTIGSGNGYVYDIKIYNRELTSIEVPNTCSEITGLANCCTGIFRLPSCSTSNNNFPIFPNNVMQWRGVSYSTPNTSISATFTFNYNSNYNFYVYMQGGSLYENSIFVNNQLIEVVPSVNPVWVAIPSQPTGTIIINPAEPFSNIYGVAYSFFSPTDLGLTTDTCFITNPSLFPYEQVDQSVVVSSPITATLPTWSVGTTVSVGFCMRLDPTTSTGYLLTTTSASNCPSILFTPSSNLITITTSQQTMSVSSNTVTDGLYHSYVVIYKSGNITLVIDKGTANSRTWTSSSYSLCSNTWYFSSTLTSNLFEVLVYPSELNYGDMSNLCSQLSRGSDCCSGNFIRLGTCFTSINKLTVDFNNNSIVSDYTSRSSVINDYYVTYDFPYQTGASLYVYVNGPLSSLNCWFVNSNEVVIPLSSAGVDVWVQVPNYPTPPFVFNIESINCHLKALYYGQFNPNQLSWTPTTTCSAVSKSVTVYSSGIFSSTPAQVPINPLPRFGPIFTLSFCVRQQKENDGYLITNSISNTAGTPCFAVLSRGSTNTVTVSIGLQTITFTPSSPIDDYNWRSLSISFNGTFAILYLDGVITGSPINIVSYGLSVVTCSIGTTLIGGQPPSSSINTFNFNGGLKSISVYSLLSDSAVSSLANCDQAETFSILDVVPQSSFPITTNSIPAIGRNINDFTFSYCSTQTSSNNGFIYSNERSNGNICFAVSSFTSPQSLTVYNQTNSVSLTIPSNLNPADGYWHSYAIVSSSGTLSYYMDGNLIGTSNSPILLACTTETAIVGKRLTQTFSGNLMRHNWTFFF